MIYNYFKMACRNLLKNKGFSFINIFGLAIGVSCCLLIFLYVGNELSYDRWNPNSERIVRPVTEVVFGGNHDAMAQSGSIVAPEAARDLPEIQSWCRFRDYGGYLVKREGEGQQNFREQHALSVDSTFFQLFPVSMIEGDPVRCLTAPDAMAISRRTAEKYFASTQAAIGQTLVLNNQERRQISAVFEEIPSNTHFRADLLLSMEGNQEVKNDAPLWAASNNFQTYLLLRPGTDLAAFEQKFDALAREKVGILIQQMLGVSQEEFEASGQFARMDLQHLPDIHLYSERSGELAPNGSIKYVWIFSSIALFILLIACINFMNLSTARSTDRAKEIGVRKVMGSRRSALIGQFLSESTLMAALAVMLAVIIVIIALPEYQRLAGQDLQMPWTAPVFWLSLVATVGLVGLLAGSYPAFFLSSFDVVKVLKGKKVRERKGFNFRSILVVFQFVTSASLIIATLFVFRQLSYIQNKKLGFEKDQILTLNNTYVLGDQIDVFKEEILKEPAVEMATVSSFLPVPSARGNTTFSKNRSFETGSSIFMQYWPVDEDYLETLGMELVDGRNFDRDRDNEDEVVILNETAASVFGEESPVGKKLYTLTGNPSGSPSPEDFAELTIIGVVKNFHWASMRENIGTLCLRLGSSRGAISFRYQGEDTEAVINALETNWKKMVPDQPFSYRFLDDSFAEMYSAEQRVGKIAAVFALLSIFVSCLGLFGLASYATEQRTKEIGIRKVLGASVVGIIGLLSKDFLKLVIIALVIALPLAFYGINRWLEDFAFRIDLDWSLFVLAVLAVLFIALLTISVQSIKTALTNPIESLKSE